MQSINWDEVGRFSPIPMPVRRAAEAVGAGFAPEWVKCSIGNWRAESQRFQGKYTHVAVQPMATRIMSESKGSDDQWATRGMTIFNGGIEYVFAGGVDVGTTISNGGTASVSGGSTISTSLTGGASQTVFSGGGDNDNDSG